MLSMLYTTILIYSNIYPRFKDLLILLPVFAVITDDMLLK